MKKKKSIKEVAKELGISYPAIRKMRISELGALGYSIVLDSREKEYINMLKFIKNPKLSLKRLKSAINKTKKRVVVRAAKGGRL